MTECKHEWELTFMEVGLEEIQFPIYRCSKCHIPMSGKEIERRLNATEALSAEDAIGYIEVCRQEYNNDKYIEAGTLENHSVDEIYIDFGNASTILLRRDEVATVIWALSGALYSLLMGEYLTGGEDE